MSDVGITWNKNAMEGVITFDSAINDLVTDDGLATAVYISLFTDAHANEDDPLPDLLFSEKFPDYRGWWGDETSGRANDSVGSKLWLLGRSKSTTDNLRKAERYAKEALQWMVEEGIAAEIKTTAEFSGDLNQRLLLLIQIIKVSNEILSYRFETLWEETVS